MSDKLRQMQVFVTAASTDSFAAAAEQLDMSAVMVGKHIRALEDQLGACLIERTTRRQSLTEIGASYLERCRDVLASVEAADMVAEHLRARPQGRLRVTAPAVYGAHRLMAVIAEYAQEYPQVQVELMLNDRVVDLAEEGIDVAVRTGVVADDTLVSRQLRPVRMLAAASPAYLAAHGEPRHPADLAQHQCMAFTGWGPNPTWRFQRDGVTEQVQVRAGFVCNSGQALLSAALAGMGVVVQSDALLETHIRSGQLHLLLPDWELPSRPLSIVRRAEVRPSAKVRSFVDVVLASLGLPA